MNYVDFFGKKVSKLIIGDNPMTGHSYITDQITGLEMYNFYSTEKIKETLWHMQELGYNTMLALCNPFMVKILRDFEYEGGNIQIIWQPFVPMNQYASMNDMLKVKNTIGIYHQGTTTDYLFETDKCDEILHMVKEYRGVGVPVGLGTHRPDVIEKSEREGWDVDFYVACLHNLRRKREGEPSGFLTGKTKDGIKFWTEDRPIMLDTLQGITKPIIAFKIFSGGKMLINEEPETKKEIIKGVYEEVFTRLKPDDFAAVGVFQRDSDQLKENAELYDEWYNSKNK